MVFKGLSKRLKKYDRLPKDPEEEQARKALDKERAEIEGVKSYVARSVVAFVQEFGERILPHPYKGGGETKSMQAVRIEVIKYHSCAKIAMSYNDVGDLHVEAGGTYCPMVVEESPVASQGQVLAYRTNFSQRSHDETTKEFFASPRQIRYYVNSSGVQESSRGVDFAAGKWGAQPSAEPYTFLTKGKNLWRTLDPLSLEPKAKWSVSLYEEGIPDSLKRRMPRSFTVTFSSHSNPHIPVARK